MIEAATMKRIARIRLHQRDERRAEVARAEDAVRAAQQFLDTRRDDERAAEARLRDFSELSPDELELRARALVETTLLVAKAKDALSEGERALELDRARRIEAERDVRGLELARRRVDEQKRASAVKAEDRLSELHNAGVRAGRRA